MKTIHANPPIVLSFSTLDPSGSGGIQADIETAASLGCHCTPIVAALCTAACSPEPETIATDATVVIEQARSILDGMKVNAIKVGFLGSTANAEAVHSILRDFKHIPVVSQPALYFWDEANPEQADLINAYSELILPMSTVTCFSLYEARMIATESDTIDTTAHAIISKECEMALITGTGKQTQEFQNSLYDNRGLIQHFNWEQEAPTSCGASSTLAMSIASYIAHGIETKQAIEQGQNFTMKAVSASRELGFGARTPHRFFWADKNIKAYEGLTKTPHIH
ncbi:MAG: hydroxymethylpyrimidine/phosphomethylpyrimidine kinase [Lentisphaeria bacterium]|jgi:hydroxymethylpyrimidine/phosphomethylpyrimidine kinase